MLQKSAFDNPSKNMAKMCDASWDLVKPQTGKMSPPTNLYSYMAATSCTASYMAATIYTASSWLTTSSDVHDTLPVLHRGLNKMMLAICLSCSQGISCCIAACLCRKHYLQTQDSQCHHNILQASYQLHFDIDNIDMPLTWISQHSS